MNPQDQAKRMLALAETKKRAQKYLEMGKRIGSRVVEQIMMDAMEAGQAAQAQQPVEEAPAERTDPRALAEAWRQAGQALGPGRPVMLAKNVLDAEAARVAAQAPAPSEAPTPQPAAPAAPPPPAPAPARVSVRPQGLTPKDFITVPNAQKPQFADPQSAIEAAHTTDEAIRSGEYAQNRQAILSRIPGFNGVKSAHQGPRDWQGSRAQVQEAAGAQTPPQLTSSGAFAGGLVHPPAAYQALPSPMPTEYVGGGVTQPRGHRTGAPTQAMMDKLTRSRMLKQAKASK